MKTGKTRVDVQASFGWRDEFTIPAGTIVQYGARDCDGNPFNKWTLPQKVAAELSGNEHDSKHRFVIVPSEYVSADVKSILI